MTTYTWDPNNRGFAPLLWTLSNGNLSARSPNTGTAGQPINYCYGTPAFPLSCKVYWEYTVTGAALLTAFGVGWSEHNANVTQFNISGPGGQIVPNTQGSDTYYNLSVNVNNANGATVVADPQGNDFGGKYASKHPGTVAAPNQWANGAVISCALDRVNSTVQYWLNGSNNPPDITGQPGNLHFLLGGPWTFAGLGSANIYPFATSWLTAGPVATINDGSTPFKYPGILAGLSGFTALSKWSVTPPVGGPSAVTIVTNPASTVTAGVAYQVIATVTAGGPWNAATDLALSTNTTAAGQDFITTITPVLSAGNTVATWSGELSSNVTSHQAYVHDNHYGNIWGPYAFTVASGAPSTVTVGVTDPSITFSPAAWYQQ